MMNRNSRYQWRRISIVWSRSGSVSNLWQDFHDLACILAESIFSRYYRLLWSVRMLYYQNGSQRTCLAENNPLDWLLSQQNRKSEVNHGQPLPSLLWRAVSYGLPQFFKPTNVANGHQMPENGIINRREQFCESGESASVSSVYCRGGDWQWTDPILQP